MLAPKRWGSLLRLGDCLLWPSYIWHGSDHCEDVVLSSSFIKSVYLHRSQQAMTTWALKEESTIRTLARPSWRPAKSKWRIYRNRLVFWIINQAQCIFIFSKYKFSPIQIEWVNWRCRTEKQFPICLTVFRLQAYYFLLIVSTIVDTFYTPESSSAFKLRKQFHVPFYTELCGRFKESGKFFLRDFWNVASKKKVKYDLRIRDRTSRTLSLSLSIN